MRPVLCFFGAAALSLLAVTAAAEVRLDDCFGDNMVIQRELPARFRGTAAPGEIVNNDLSHVASCSVRQPSVVLESTL